MKKLVGIGFGLFLVLLVSGKVAASEGTANLEPVNGFSGQCFAASVYQDRMYKVLVTCRDLKVSYSPEGNYYILWAENEEGKVFRLGEIVRGKIYTAIDQPFKKLFVTVENSAYPRKASDQRVMEGNVEAIFGNGGQESRKNLETLNTESSTKVEPQVTSAPSPLIPSAKVENQGWSFGRVIGILGRIIGLTILVLVVAGVVLTIVTRRKEQ